MKFFNTLQSKNAVQIPQFHNYIYQLIKHTGPMTVYNFMREILTNKDHGYYMNQNIFGKKGDFITSPEISQMFGELIGIWIVNEWMRQDKCIPFQIIELGPGKGSLICDALKAISKFPKLFNNLSIKLVEISPNLRKFQENSLTTCFRGLKCDVPVDWFDDLTQIQKQTSCYLAHEFFDALPIHKFQRRPDGKWRELLVDLEHVDSENKKLNFVLADRETPATLAFKNTLDEYPSMKHLELNPMSISVLDDISKRILDSSGFALFADYGHFGDKGDTFRAFRGHQHAHPLEHLGQCDLTADLNFKTFTDFLEQNFQGNC